MTPGLLFEKILYLESISGESLFSCDIATCLSDCLSARLPPSVPRGAFPSDQREHQPEGPVVVHRPDPDPGGHRHLADETPEELLRGQEAGVALHLGECV